MLNEINLPSRVFDNLVFYKCNVACLKKVDNFGLCRT